jgi:hypothetical protein
MPLASNFNLVSNSHHNSPIEKYTIILQLLELISYFTTLALIQNLLNLLNFHHSIHPFYRNHGDSFLLSAG